MLLEGFTTDGPIGFLRNFDTFLPARLEIKVDWDGHAALVSVICSNLTACEASMDDSRSGEGMVAVGVLGLS